MEDSYGTKFSALYWKLFVCLVDPEFKTTAAVETGVMGLFAMLTIPKMMCLAFPERRLFIKG